MAICGCIYVCKYVYIFIIIIIPHLILCTLGLAILIIEFVSFMSTCGQGVIICMAQ